VASIKQHTWFEGFDWTALADRKMKAPWIPPAENNHKQLISDFPETNAQAI